jgi:hypothetical protein
MQDAEEICLLGRLPGSVIMPNGAVKQSNQMNVLIFVEGICANFAAD